MSKPPNEPLAGRTSLALVDDVPLKLPPNRGEKTVQVLRYPFGYQVHPAVREVPYVPGNGKAGRNPIRGITKPHPLNVP